MFEVTAHLTICEGQLDSFKQAVAEVVRQAREKDTRTLRYDFFLSDDGRRCEVHEAYVDADAFVAHQQHTAEARTRLLHQFAEDHRVAFYGELSPALTHMMTRLPGADAIGRFAFLQGLDADAVAS
jgi:quinol monooxygenase YgiN